MLPEKFIKVLEKQHYGLVGGHSGVQICRWCKKDLTDSGECYKAKFYGIKSHRCCQMSPVVGFCQNKCMHCWRAIELTVGSEMDESKVDSPEEIIEGCIKQQQRLLNGFKGNSKINMEKLKNAQEPNQFAISLTGEPTLYPRLGELISCLRKMGKTSFVVTNGLQPEVLKVLGSEGNLPTQLYLSLNSPSKELYDKWHRSCVKNAWEKLNESLDLFAGLKTRRVIRMTLVKGEFNNMKDEMIEDYVKLIKKACPDFIEVKGFMSVGFARNREGMGYETMPSYDEVKRFALKLVSELGDCYKILDEHEFSRVVLVGKDEKRMKIEEV